LLNQGTALDNYRTARGVRLGHNLAVLARLLSSTDDPADEPDAVSERILDAALAQFQTFGLRRTTVDDVAKRARLGRATVYRRFESKDRLVAAVLLREGRRMLAQLDVAMAGVEPAGERLVQGMVIGVRLVRGRSLFTRLIEIEPDFVLPYLTTHAGELLAMGRAFVAEHIRRAQAEGAVAAHLDPDVVAELLIRLAQSLMLTPAGVIPEDDAALREFARDHVVGPLGTAKPAQLRAGGL
jgi:AcrR family transcriptional regulator